MIVLLLTAVSFLVSYFGIKQFRSWSLKRNLLDIPNERSSHYRPTPRGGGIVFALYFVILLIAYLSFGSHFQLLGLLAGTILIVGISWLDDLYTIPSALRLLVHIAAAVLVTVQLGAISVFSIPSIFTFAMPEFLGFAITVIWIVCIVNAYNFMDGIDGLAGVQAFLTGIGWLGIGIYYDLFLVQLISALISFSSLGFLIHNWAPAKIFMGDVGSAFLGFVFACIPLIAVKESSENAAGFFPAAAIILLWPFLMDFSLTLVKRVLTGKRFWQAHREHFYQRMVISGKSHSAVSLLYAVFGIACTISLVPWILFSGKWGLLTLFTSVTVILIMYLLTKSAEKNAVINA